MGKEKNIEKRIHETWEQKGLLVIKLEEEIKQYKEQINEIKEELKEEMAKLNIDVYKGRDVRFFRILKPTQYSVPIETAIKYATLQELFDSKVLMVNKKEFEALMEKKNIKLELGEYAVSVKDCEYLSIKAVKKEK